MSPPEATHDRPKRLGLLTLAALGVVFGDIGTSPLYTLHECFHSQHGVPPRPDNVLGILSLIFWSLTMVVGVKYLTAILRADNHGEGGIFALLALLPPRTPDDARPGTPPEPAAWAALLVIAGASLLYGDGMITPAISVLSAIEGLEVGAPGLKPLVLPLTCGVLIALFLLQKRGTGKVGTVFGPVMLLWFVTIGVLGLRQIVRQPSILQALNPLLGLRLFVRERLHGLVVLGAVVLAVTGGEALYADLGHFGRRPIRAGWFALVMPALVASYFGQGALLLREGPRPSGLFFAMVPPGPATFALVILSTAATVIASQALISGAFSMTNQAVQLGYLPRFTVAHTSSEKEGQIYVPQVNWILACACVALVLAFRKSERLAAAYGFAVTGTMVITSIVFFEVTRTTWRWPLWKSLPLLLLFFAFDIPFFAANLLKIPEGGFVPLVIGAVVFAVMVTWKRGRRIYRQRMATDSKPLANLIAGGPHADLRQPTRCPGTGVFLTSHPEGFPPVVMNLVQRVRVLPEIVVLLTMEVLHVPHAAASEIEAHDLGNGIYRVLVKQGFMDAPDVPRALVEAARRFQLPLHLENATYYLGRDSFLATSAGEMGQVSERFFALLARAARSSTDHFGIPANQVVELGSQIDL
ncbi:MAG TPA: KUP/HAK/KT family potassium transporter [Polyangia bacterium]|nr:KUP/HAK/KT family potassium transporter [Polyangia bacterium]